MPPARKWTAAEIKRALYSHFADRYAVVFEATARSWEGAASTRRIDALLVRRAPADKTAAKRNVTAAAGVLAAGLGAEFIGGDSLFPVPAAPEPGDNGGLERTALEIKVTRQDFLNDVRNPDKQAPWRELSNRHAYVVPAGLVGVSEVPRESGLLVVTDQGDGRCSVEWARRAPKSAAARPLTIGQQLDAFYRWSRAEAAAMGFTGPGRGQDVETVRLENDRLRKALELAENLAERRSEKIGQLQTRIAAFEPLACSTCGRPLRPARPRKARTDTAWEHVAADEVECLALRTAVAQAEHDQAVAEAEVRYGKDGRSATWMRERSLYIYPPLPVYPGDEEDGGQARLASQSD